MADIGGESIDLSKLGTALVAFAFVLVIGIGLFAVGRTVTSDGSEKVQKQLEDLGQSEFTDYDQKIVRGTKVKAAYESLSQGQYAVLIATNLNLVKGKTGPTVADKSDFMINVMKNDGTSAYQVTTTDSANPEKDLWCMNYHTVLDGGSIKAKDGYFICSSGFKMDDDGMLVYNDTIANMNKQGYPEYIPSNAQFMSNVIKDETGLILGVMFTQQMEE